MGGRVRAREWQCVEIVSLIFNLNLAQRVEWFGARNAVGVRDGVSVGVIRVRVRVRVGFRMGLGEEFRAG